MESSNPKVVQISQLSLPQLDHLKTQLEEVLYIIIVIIIILSLIINRR